MQIEDGFLAFLDETTDPPFRGRWSHVNGHLDGFSWPQLSIDQLVVEASGVGGDPVRISGQVSPEGSELSIQGRGDSLVRYSPHVAARTGLEVVGGTGSLDSTVRIDGSEVRAPAHLVLSRLELKSDEPTLSPDRLAKMPLAVALALLTDARGDITLDLDLAFGREEIGIDWLSLFAAGLQRSLVRATTAPLRLIGALTASGALPEAPATWLGFVPGRASLSEEGRHRVHALAKLLAERPELAIRLHATATDADLATPERRAHSDLDDDQWIADLEARRALAVASLLEDEYAVMPERVRVGAARVRPAPSGAGGGHCPGSPLRAGHSRDPRVRRAGAWPVDARRGRASGVTIPASPGGDSCNPKNRWHNPGRASRSSPRTAIAAGPRSSSRSSRPARQRAPSPTCSATPSAAPSRCWPRVRVRTSWQSLPDAQAADLLDLLEPATAAAIMNELPSDAQADLLSLLAEDRADVILANMEPEEARTARRLAAYPGDLAGGLMIAEFLHYPAHATVQDVVDDIRAQSDRYASYDVQYAYVTARDGRLVGVLALRDLLLSAARTPVRSLMIEKPLRVSAEATLDELRAFFEEHPFVGVPVVADRGTLVGVVRRAKVLEALEGRSESDHLKTQGIVGGEELRTMPVLVRSRRRLAWLSVNIVLNLIAASVIALYQETLQAVIALAVFLPIISDMSGCSGNQAVAVSMRELTLGLIRPMDAVARLAQGGVGRAPERRRPGQLDRRRGLGLEGQSLSRGRRRRRHGHQHPGRGLPRRRRAAPAQADPRRSGARLRSDPDDRHRHVRIRAGPRHRDRIPAVAESVLILAVPEGRAGV